MIFQSGRKGFNLSLPDALIAATALLDKMIVVTTNHKHFSMLDVKVLGV